MRPITALAIALAVTTAGPAFADPKSHAPIVHHEAKSDGAAAHAMAGHAAESKTTRGEDKAKAAEVGHELADSVKLVRAYEPNGREVEKFSEVVSHVISERSSN